MTDESATEKEAIISVPQVDAILEYLITLSELGVGMPVILFVKGTIVAGYILSFENYLKEIAAELRNSTNQIELDQEVSQKGGRKDCKRFRYGAGYLG